MNKKDMMEENIVGYGMLIFGILLILVGIIVNDKLWFSLIMAGSGIVFSVLAAKYLTRKRHW